MYFSNYFILFISCNILFSVLYLMMIPSLFSAEPRGEISSPRGCDNLGVITKLLLCDKGYRYDAVSDVISKETFQ